MTTPEPQGLTFPCVYGVKAMGLASADFAALVESIVRTQVSDIAEGAIASRPSTNGKYVSVTIDVEVTSRAQLEAIYAALRAHERVLMTL